MTEFTHLTGDRVRMVDISEKKEVSREAMARGRIFLRTETLVAVRQGSTVKGNVLATARVAATLAVKQTSLLIPLCHQIPLTSVDVAFTHGEEYIEAEVTVRSRGRTGVEMEALTGTAIALLTIWDMVKSAEKDEQGQYPFTRIEGIQVVEKKKGT
jgi:cyclic pyranopterin phosphate synthase